MKFHLSLVVIALAALLCAAPAVANTPDAPISPATTEAAPSLDPETFTIEDLETLVAPAAQEQSSCSASTTCGDGTTISCTGHDYCFTEPRCAVLCDGRFTQCPSFCP